MLTVRNQVVMFVAELARTQFAFDELERRVRAFNQQQLIEALLECGVIPEAFEHDSSEEKLWAKYCDILLAMAFEALGMSAQVIRLRGNSADVLATGHGHTIVGDAKAFRLSRTAKNQKDFKVKALNDWRRENTFACLVAPLTQFPNTRSQIYEQAVEMNVALFSYTHLRFLIEQNFITSLETLWRLPATLNRTGSAVDYWAAIDNAICLLCDSDLSTLNNLKQLEIDKQRELGNEGIEFWTQKIAEYEKLSQAEAVTRLIKSEKIEAKIRTIRRAINESIA